MALLAATAATAQQAMADPPPVFSAIDAQGIDVTRGTFNFAVTEVAIGQPGQGLSLDRFYSSGVSGSLDAGWRDNLTGTLQTDYNGTYFVSIGGMTSSFRFENGEYVSLQQNGATLTADGANTWIWTSSTGVRAVFDTTWGQPTNTNDKKLARIVSLRQPTGEELSFYYAKVTYSSGSINEAAVRLQSVTSNRGYQIKIEYALDTPSYGMSEWPEYLRMTKATAFNMAVDYCDPAAMHCPTFSRTWPSATYTQVDSDTASVTDQSNRTTTYTYDYWRMTGIQWPGSTSDDVVIAYSGIPATSVTIGGDAWTYAYTGDSATLVTTVTNPSSGERVVASTRNTGRPNSDTNEVGDTTSFGYDEFGRLTTISSPEFNYTFLQYDGRGNITSRALVPKPGSGETTIWNYASYPATCPDPITCNLPLTTTDGRGYVTDYTWHATTGLPLTVTGPAPEPGAPRPQVRYTTGSLYAWYKDGTGAIVQAPTPIRLITRVSACPGANTCLNGPDEARTQIVYGAAGVANNLLPTIVQERSGDASVIAVNSLTYTPDGDVATIDGPLPGTADTTMLRYDDARQLVGVVAPDPDGAGPLLHRATRNNYNPRGQVEQTEAGTVAGYTDPQWAAFASLQQVATLYDAAARPAQTTFSASGTTYGLRQYTYDDARLHCTALRMNPATYAAPPSSACVQATAGAYGPDRITRTLYDAAGRVTDVIEGLGTPAVRHAMIATYTANGQVETLLDGQSNLTTYEYDGHDRLEKVRYPIPTNGSVSSTTDYDLYGYDAAFNMVSHRNRGGQTTTATYDALNRLTFLEAPVGTNDIAYAYDNLGRLLEAEYPGGHALAFAWDALGRQVSQTSSALGTYGYQYDAASRRTRITWNDGFYAQYDYDLTGAMTAVRENGATTGPGVLATYAYDNLGRRTGITRGNGVTTTLNWDPASRLTDLSHDLASSAADLSLTLGRNPAGQITTRMVSNDLYVYDDFANGTVDYSIDGLNRVTVVDSAPLTYDARGNLTDDSVAAYVYDDFNRLTSADGTTLQYDPAGRLYREIDAANTRFGWAGGQLIAEHLNVSLSFRRHVPGPGLGAPVASYEGYGTTMRSWPLTDERGSVIALTDGAGTASVINTYDEYGLPDATNAGRFAYTGQLALAGTGLYYYRARAYHPGLGRFMQTDPVGYADGMNWYAYVGNDPVNRVDPWGLWDVSDRPGDSCVTTEPGCGTTTTNFDPILLDWSIENQWQMGRISRLPHLDGFIGGPALTTQRCSSSPSDGLIGSARFVLENVATGADVATVGFIAGGVTAPVAVATKAVGVAMEAGLLGVNIYDSWVNDNSAPLNAQVAGAVTRLVPGGRVLQRATRTLRGSTGPLRNSRGQFRTSHINNPGVEEFGNVIVQDGTEGIVRAVACN